jgi:hypothetical protein
MVLAFLAFVCGLVLDTVTRGRREVKRLAYLPSRLRASRARRSRNASTTGARRRTGVSGAATTAAS